MANSPSIWRSPFIANLTTTGSQYGQRMIQLANGNLLVAWTSDDQAGPGSPNGTDVIAQLFDPRGNAIGSEFRLNTLVSDANESLEDIVALPNGGFIALYRDLVDPP